MAVLPSIDSPTALYPGPPRSDFIEPDPDEALALVRRRIGLADRLHSFATAAAGASRRPERACALAISGGAGQSLMSG
jgi:hypothetical protein